MESKVVAGRRSLIFHRGPPKKSSETWHGPECNVRFAQCSLTIPLPQSWLTYSPPRPDRRLVNRPSLSFSWSHYLNHSAKSAKIARLTRGHFSISMDQWAAWAAKGEGGEINRSMLHVHNILGRSKGRLARHVLLKNKPRLRGSSVGISFGICHILLSGSCRLCWCGL